MDIIGSLELKLKCDLEHLNFMKSTVNATMQGTNLQIWIHKLLLLQHFENERPATLKKECA